jgi:two-component system, cell cycle response regulator
MKKKFTLSRTAVYILQETDEMRHPYESALGPVGAEVVWFQSADKLLNSTGREPLAVIVDFDCVAQPVEKEIERLRAYYGNSDLIALSSSDSAQLALQCLRSGFVDFLLKPTSPEELAWCIRKCQQRREVLQRLSDKKSSMVRAVTQISSCTTPTLVRIYLLEYLQSLFQGMGAAWLRLDARGPEFMRVLCAVPKRMDMSQVLFELPFENISFEKKERIVVKNKKNTKRKLLLPCEDYPQGGIFVWGIPDKVTKRLLTRATTLIEHAELSLLNLRKFDEVKQQTFVDDLTGLYNSRYLKFALNNFIQRCKEPNQHFSVLFIDIDHFKKVNDEHSHMLGSEFLVTIGKTIKHTVRKIDPVFRYGGDEFVVLLNGTEVEGAMEIAERIRKSIERRIFLIKDAKIQTTVSIGIATYPIHASDRDTLLKLADEAMYSAKKQTRNAVHLALGLSASK